MQSGDNNETNAIINFSHKYRYESRGAYDLGTGTFTAPTDGMYHFVFQMYSEDYGSTGVYLRLNGNVIESNYFIYGDDGPKGSIFHGSTLVLALGDRVWWNAAYGLSARNNCVGHLCAFVEGRKLI